MKTTKIDTIDSTKEKYIHNIKGVFTRLRCAIVDLESKNISCVPSPIIETAKNAILKKDTETCMMELVEGIIENKCDDLLKNKNISFFEDHWRVFTGKNTDKILLDISKSIFENKGADGSLIYDKKYIDCIFAYLYSAFKVSIKFVLLKSGIKSMERGEDDNIIYHLENKILDCCDDNTISKMISKHEIVGIPTL